MATIGQQLTSPESGWKRYDSTNISIKYVGSWNIFSSASHYNGSSMFNNSGNGTDNIKFDFIGTKLRIIAVSWSSYSNNIEIDIDGVKEYYSQQLGFNGDQILLYEKTGLENKRHSVTIKRISGNNYFSLDAIDIDDIGRLLHPDEVLDPKDLAIGKRIRCHYQASSGQVGVFSELGQETSNFIPPASSATPNGDFYWICCDIKNGKKILLADRNIQHSISWDKINEQGMTNTGREITF